MKFNMSALMEYRASFLIQTFGMILNNTAFIFFWWILFEHVEVIGGYGFKDVMLLWSLASTSFGISFVVFGRASQITDVIMTGELDSFLLQPRDPIVNMVASRSSLSSWGDMLYGILLFAFLQELTLASVGLFALFCITGGLILTAVMVSVHSLSFHLGNASSFARLITEFMVTFGIYPEGIFTGGLKFMFYTVIPVAFTAYLPAKVITLSAYEWILPVLLGTLVWILVAYYSFYKGLRKYESGNLIINRL